MNEADIAMYDLLRYQGRLEHHLKYREGCADWEVTVQRVYRVRHGRLHAILNVGPNEYHVVYAKRGWRRA